MTRERHPPLTQLAHDWLAPALGPGRWALDATAGNGRDTLFLAQRVAPGGRVDAFDVQPRALARARRRVEASGTHVEMRWHRADHARLGRHIGTGPFDAVVFNLGWLPGGDRRVVTTPASTGQALSAAVERLACGGRLTVVAYRGHPGGSAEADAVAAWLDRLGPRVHVEPPCPADERPEAPVLHRLRVLP